MPARKTFANNAVLSATDLNTYMNPSTAAHVPDAQAAGQVAVPQVNAGTQAASIPVTFPTGRFTQPPHVSVITNSARHSLAIAGLTATGFSLVVANWSPATASAATAWWTATQMTPTNAAG